MMLLELYCNTSTFLLYISNLYILQAGEGQNGGVEENEMEMVLCYKQFREVTCLQRTQPYLRASFPYDKYVLGLQCIILPLNGVNLVMLTY